MAQYLLLVTIPVFTVDVLFQEPNNEMSNKNKKNKVLCQHQWNRGVQVENYMGAEL